MKGAWRTIRRVWIAAGLLFTIVFVGWSLLAYRASDEARRSIVSNSRVTVARAEGAWTFIPGTGGAPTGLMFFAGALVDPTAYAPLLRDVAEAGFPAVLVELPRRGAFGGADGPAVLARAAGLMSRMTRIDRWVVSGHSRGGVVAARMAFETPARIDGLILIGTSHPRDFSLASAAFPVTHVYGTRDTVADEEKVMAAQRNLPPTTRLVRIDGGNHSQFGWYGFQPGDWPATITREEQQRLTLVAILELLRRVDTAPQPSSSGGTVP
jgi:pimeloyl-ACP methyl ester carboxylesterase